MKFNKAARPAKAFRYEIPARADVASNIESLIKGNITRQEVAEWAAEYVTYDDPQIYPEINDKAVWEALVALVGADQPSTDRPYLYELADFQAWLEALKGAQ